MPSDESKRGAVAWLRQWWRPLVSEVVSTALLVLLGVASMLPLKGPTPTHPPLTHPALAFGFIVLVNIEAFGPTSGAHMNPAVTLAALLDRRIGAIPAIGYVFAQLVGATLGFGSLMLLSPDSFSGENIVGDATPGSVGVVAAAVVEAILTGMLVLACCAVWTAHDAGNPDPTASIKLGLCVAGVVYAGGVMTGASLNPARSFGPALLQKFRPDHWVYWVGPLGGSALATLLHRHVLRPRRAVPPRAEDVPLQDKQDHLP